MTDRDRLLDLLTSRATVGLTPEESAELERLLGGQTEFDGDDLELAAAEADLAMTQDLESMPDDLKRRIMMEASAHLPDEVRSIEEHRAKKTGPLSPRYLGWYAAAAMLVLAVWAPWRTTETPPLPLTPAAQRAALIETAPDLVRVDWAQPEIAEYAQVRGDVVWSSDTQTGFMRLRGLPANRPSKEQYQLWIVDPSRDERPVDGGVFDIPSGAEEIVVPIHAKLLIDDPRAFAITLERPGGVVVSDGPLLVVAPVEG